MGTQFKMIDYFYAYGMTWFEPSALVLAVLLILAEFAVGICLFFNWLPRIATIGAGVLMVFFTCTTFADAVWNLVPDCGCFGNFITLTNWQTFFKNLIILIVLVPLLFNFKQLTNRDVNDGGQWFFALLFCGGFVYFQIYSIRNLPLVDFMEWKEGKDMRPKEEKPLEVYLTFKNVATGEEKEYLSNEYPYNDSLWNTQWEFVSQRSEGGVEPLLFSMSDEYENDFTDLIFDTDSLLIVVSYNIKQLDKENLSQCQTLVNNAEALKLRTIFITGSQPKDMHQVQFFNPIFEEVFYGDELEIKTMVRSNPGALLMSNGVVLKKWSHNNFPNVDELSTLLEK